MLRGVPLRPLSVTMFAWAVTFGFPANAQVPGGVAPPVDQLRRPGDEPLIVPEPTQPKAPPIVTPAPKLTPPAPVLSQGARVRARGFRFTGNTVVSEPELQSLAAPFIGRELGNAELEDLRVRITHRYIDAGYINSGATLPDQDISDGVIRYEIVEGRLTEILVGGNNRFRPGYLRDRLALGAEPVLNVNQLQERVQILLQDPQIERITAELAPGTQRGEASLRADVTGTPHVIAGVSFSNDRRRGSAAGVHRHA
jgi:hemolysin activation/secretion protein